jgi:hypothetical protein
MWRLLGIASRAVLIASAATAQTASSPPTGSSTPSAQCAPGQALQANGQSCLPPVPTQAPVVSTGQLGQFPTDLLPATPDARPSGSSATGNALPGQQIPVGQ